MGEGRHPYQLTAPGRGLRHWLVDRGAARRARQGLQHDHRAIQDEEPAEDRGRVQGRGRSRRRKVRAALRQDHRRAGPRRRRQRARRLKVEPIRWKGDRLELLDQRLLPGKKKYVTCRTAEQVAKAIKDMVVRGAPAIGCAAAFGVVLSKGSRKAYEVLAKSRPTAVNLFLSLIHISEPTR